MTDQKTPQPIEFQSRGVDGERNISVSGPWPDITEVMPDQLDDLPAGLVVLDGDNLTITVANGTAQYLKTGAKEDGTLLFELLESTFDPAADASEQPAATQAAPAEEPVDQASLIIDTRAEDEPLLQKRKTFGEVLTGETRAAFARGDMSAHAAIHNFEIAAGDFKRAAQALAPTLPEDSDLRSGLESIISDL